MATQLLHVDLDFDRALPSGGPLMNKKLKEMGARLFCPGGALDDHMTAIGSNLTRQWADRPFAVPRALAEFSSSVGASFVDGFRSSIGMRFVDQFRFKPSMAPMPLADHYKPIEYPKPRMIAADAIFGAGGIAPGLRQIPEPAIDWDGFLDIGRLEPAATDFALRELLDEARRKSESDCARYEASERARVADAKASALARARDAKVSRRWNWAMFLVAIAGAARAIVGDLVAS
jgi:hypothetical protein